MNCALSSFAAIRGFIDMSELEILRSDAEQEAFDESLTAILNTTAHLNTERDVEPSTLIAALMQVVAIYGNALMGPEH